MQDQPCIPCFPWHPEVPLSEQWVHRAGGMQDQGLDSVFHSTLGRSSSGCTEQVGCRINPGFHFPQHPGVPSVSSGCTERVGCRIQPCIPCFNGTPGCPLSGQWVLAPLPHLLQQHRSSLVMQEEPCPVLSWTGDPGHPSRAHPIPFLPPRPPPPQSTRVCELTGNGGTRAFLSALMKPFNHIQIGYCSGGK